MKMERGLWLGILGILTFLLWKAFEFKNTQNSSYQKARTYQEELREDLKILEAEKFFLKTHQENLIILKEKGWLEPKSRLKAGEFLSLNKGNLHSLFYTFAPEILKLYDETIPFKVTSVTLEVRAFVDTDIYHFFEDLMKAFPGILVPRDIKLSRVFEEGSDLIMGTLIFDWVSMGEEP